LAALSQLQQLSFEVTVPVGSALRWRQHLVPLTALINLTSLSCSLAFDSHEDDDFPDQSFVSVVNEVGAQPQGVGLFCAEVCGRHACWHVDSQGPLPAAGCMPVLHSMFAKTAQHAVLLVLVQAPAGSRSDVWLQLLEECAKDQPAQTAVIRCMLRQLQQQRQQVAEQAVQLEQQEQQLAAARAEAAAEAVELRGQLQASEGRAQQQEQQLAEQAARLQQQEQRLQDVEGQLREVLATLRHQA
jgi:hypothetical protein